MKKGTDVVIVLNGEKIPAIVLGSVSGAITVKSGSLIITVSPEEIKK